MIFHRIKKLDLVVGFNPKCGLKNIVRWSFAQDGKQITFDSISSSDKGCIITRNPYDRIISGFSKTFYLPAPTDKIFPKHRLPSEPTSQLLALAPGTRHPGWETTPTPKDLRLRWEAAVSQFQFNSNSFREYVNLILSIPSQYINAHWKLQTCGVEDFLSKNQFQVYQTQELHNLPCMLKTDLKINQKIPQVSRGEFDWRSIYGVPSPPQLDFDVIEKIYSYYKRDFELLNYSKESWSEFLCL